MTCSGNFHIVACSLCVRTRTVLVSWVITYRMILNPNWRPRISNTSKSQTLPKSDELYKTCSYRYLLPFFIIDTLNTREQTKKILSPPNNSLISLYERGWLRVSASCLRVEKRTSWANVYSSRTSEKSKYKWKARLCVNSGQSTLRY